MRGKSVLQPHAIISAGDMSKDITSSTTNVQYLDNISIQAVFSGSPVGVLKVQASLDELTWNTLETLSISGAGDQLYDLNQLSFPYIRVFYDFTSGTGSLTVLISGKQV